MNDDEFKGRLRQMMNLQRKQIWYTVGQYVLGALTAGAIIVMIMLFMLMDG